MSYPITKKQKELLDFLKVYFEKWGFAPTYGEISEVFINPHTNKPLTEASVWERLNNLEKAGRIKIYRFKPRGIEIL